MLDPDRYVAAVRFAAERHGDQRVPGTSLPYVTHVVSVATEVACALSTTPDLDPDLAIVCALLHDTVEDTATTLTDVEARFGAAVARGVHALSKDAALPKPDRMTDSLRRILAEPREVAAVKLADRIVNLARPPADWSRDKRLAYRAEARQIADALGAACPTLHQRLLAKIDAYAAYLDEPRAD